MYKRLFFLCCGLLTGVFASHAQIIKERFNYNVPPSIQVATVKIKGTENEYLMDTVFRDLPVTIRLTDQQLRDTAVQRHLEEISGAHHDLAKALGYDRVVTKLEVGKSKFSWVYIYDVVRPIVLKNAKNAKDQ